MKVQMTRQIGPLALLFLSFTAMFGSGWLFAPYFAAQIAGPAALIAWVIGALMSMVIGLTMAEVIILFPQTGGVNTVAQLTHGKLIGFLTNMLMVTVCVILPTLEVRAILQYLSSQTHFFIDAQGAVTGCGYIAAGLLLLLINVVNVYGAKLTTRINNCSFFLKILTPLLMGGVFCFTLFHQGQLSFDHVKPFSSFSLSDIFLAISTSGIIFSFNGFNQATLFAAEAKNPARTIPFAILGSILITACLYLFIQTIFLLAVPQSALANGWANLHYTGDVGPFNGLAVLLGLHWLLYFIYVDAVISPLGTAFTYSSGAPRMIYATAENSETLPFLRRLNARGIPTNAVILSLLLSFLAFILLPNLKAMISILVAAFVLNYTVAPVSLLTLRQTAGDTKRPFRIPCAGVLCFLSILFSEIMAFCSGFDSIKNLVLILTITYALGLMVCIRKPEQLKGAVRGATWFWLQTLGIGIVSYAYHLQGINFAQAIGCLSILAFLITRYAPGRAVSQAKESLELAPNDL